MAGSNMTTLCRKGLRQIDVKIPGIKQGSLMLPENVGFLSGRSWTRALQTQLNSFFQVRINPRISVIRDKSVSYGPNTPELGKQNARFCSFSTFFNPMLRSRLIAAGYLQVTRLGFLPKR